MSERTALVLKPDTLGDLILFAPTLAALVAAKEGWRWVVLVRHSYLDLARRLVPGIDWLTTSLDPFGVGPEPGGDERAWNAELERLKVAVAALKPDLIVAACPRRNWLDAALMLGAPKARHVAFQTAAEDPYFGTQARLRLGADLARMRVEVAPGGAGEQDWERNFGLADFLLSKPAPRTPPAYLPEPALLAAADGVLAVHAFVAGGYLACGAAGFANVRIKTWPAERFAEVLSAVRRRHGLSALLIGHHSEAEYLERIRATAGEGAAVWTGGEGDLGLMAALIKRSRAYFGNDTGALHVAAAVGVPVIGVYGGGTWPRFTPGATEGAAIVHPLPCFGCGWDCAFGDAPCVKAIGAADVAAEIERVLAEPAMATRALQTLPDVLVEFMGHTAAIARERSAAHLEREHKLQEIAYLAGEKDGEILSLKAAANEKDAEIGALKAAADEKDLEIRALKQATDEKDTEIAVLTREHEARAQIIAGLEQACKERLELIIDLDQQLKRRAAER